MQQLREFCRLAYEVEELYERLQKQLQNTHEGRSYSCPVDCGQCCENSFIEAQPIEFYPAAWQLYQTNLLEPLLEKLSAWPTAGFCVFYDQGRQGKGKCGFYNQRGLICRLFGFAYRKDKNAGYDLVACRLLKEHLPAEAKHLEAAEVSEAANFPVFTRYYKELGDIDFVDAHRSYKINSAIRVACQRIYYIGKYGKKVS